MERPVFLKGKHMYITTKAFTITLPTEKSESTICSNPECKEHKINVHRWMSGKFCPECGSSIEKVESQKKVQTYQYENKYGSGKCPVQIKFGTYAGNDCVWVDDQTRQLNPPMGHYSYCMAVPTYILNKEYHETLRVWLDSKNMMPVEIDIMLKTHKNDD